MMLQRAVGTTSLVVFGLWMATVTWVSTRGVQSLDQAPRASTPFEQAPVIAIIRIRLATEQIATTFEGEELGCAHGRLRTYWSNEGRIVRMIHLNGKDPGDPDLSGGVAIEQVTRERNRIRFELGRSYLLLLRRSTNWYWAPECSRGCTLLNPSFELAAEQGGYEVVNNRLRVLRRGGPLDAFDGKSVDELVSALSKSAWVPARSARSAPRH